MTMVMMKLLVSPHRRFPLQAAALAAIAEVNCMMKFSPRTAAVSAVDSVQDAANGLLALEGLTVAHGWGSLGPVLVAPLRHAPHPSSTLLHPIPASLPPTLAALATNCNKQ